MRATASSPGELLKGCYRLFRIRDYIPEKVERTVNGKKQKVDHPIWVWKKHVARYAKQQWTAPCLQDVCFQVRSLFVLPRPKNHHVNNDRSRPLKRNAPVFAPNRGTGDGDNFQKAVWDTLEGMVWHNDSQIVIHDGAKRYVRQGELPQAVIAIRLISDNNDAVWLLDNADEDTTRPIDHEAIFEAARFLRGKAIDAKDPKMHAARMIDRLKDETHNAFDQHWRYLNAIAQQTKEEEKPF